MKPRRIQLSRAKGWRMPPNTVSVAWPSRWGNPYRIGPSGDALDCVEQFRLACERGYTQTSCADNNWTMEGWLAPLRGKNLACWCKLDQPCHADVLLELANS